MACATNRKRSGGRQDKLFDFMCTRVIEAAATNEITHSDGRVGVDREERGSLDIGPATIALPVLSSAQVPSQAPVQENVE